MRILFSDENCFDIDGFDNYQNDRMWALGRADADKKGVIKRRRKFPQKVMVWSCVCSKDIMPLVIFDEGNSRSYCLYQSSAFLLP